MTSRRFAIFAVFLLAAELPALAASNFTGDWKLNASKSEFGQMPAPSSMSAKIEHQDPSLKTTFKQSGDQGEFEFASTYTTDGKECTNEMFGNPIKSTLKWDGDNLIIDSKASFGDNEFTMQDKWSLSADGKTLTINRTFKSAMGDGSQKLVLEKQ